MEGEGLRMCPAPKLAGFWTQHVSDCRVGIHKSSSDNETDTENAPSDLLEPPEDSSVSNVFKPEVFCIEMRQGEEAAHRNQHAQRPEQIRLQFVMNAAPPVTAPSIPKDTPY